MNKWFKELNLKENSLYKVKVKITQDNIEHISFLFTGFKTGNYTYIYNNTYEHPVSISKVYSIKILKQLN